MKTIGYIISIILFFFFGSIIGLLTAEDKYISERLQLCEEKGGKYNLIWMPYSKEYYEKCEVMQEEIHLP